MTMKPISDTTGPLLAFLPQAPDAATQLLLVEKLGGHTTSESWLPQGLSDELDQLRIEMLRLRGELLAVLEERAALLAEHAAEDKAHAEALKEAARSSDRVPEPEDERTPPERRDLDLGAVEAKLWAGLHVLAECADAVIEHLRRNESSYLADLRQQLEPLREKRAEAQRLLASADAEAWQLHQRGAWLQNACDDGPMGRQPTPGLVPAPATFNRELLRDSLERPWHRRDRPWLEAEVAA